VKPKVVVLGPGPLFKGGISNFTVSLSKAFDGLGAEVHLVSWKRQYPAFIPRDFIDRSSTSNLLENSQVIVHTITDYNNPITWFQTAALIASLNPDLVVVQWAIAIQGLPLGVICRRLKKMRPQTRIIFDVHNVVQKETGSLDRLFTRYALPEGDEFIFHGKLTLEEFRAFLPELKLIPAAKLAKEEEYKFHELFHPMYDIFQNPSDFDIEAEKQKLGLRKTVFLFFGFIRKYKGLHDAIAAFSRIAAQNPDASLLIVGESFWNQKEKRGLMHVFKRFLFKLAKQMLIKNASNEQDYQPLELIDLYGIREQTVVINHFVPNEEVYRWFKLSDAVVNFYEYATPSGVESLAYHFSKPVLATRVGHFSYAIEDGKNGYLAEPGNIDSMAATLRRFIEYPIPEERVKLFTSGMTWEKYASAILYSNKPD
jgi:glycosyltransferase involved in cell wall biosynthesis